MFYLVKLQHSHSRCNFCAGRRENCSGANVCFAVLREIGNFHETVPLTGIFLWNFPNDVKGNWSLQFYLSGYVFKEHAVSIFNVQFYLISSNYLNFFGVHNLVEDIINTVKIYRNNRKKINGWHWGIINIYFFIIKLANSIVILMKIIQYVCF